MQIPIIYKGFGRNPRWFSRLTFFQVAPKEKKRTFSDSSCLLRKKSCWFLTYIKKLRSEWKLIKDPFQLLPGSTRGTYSQSVLEKKRLQRIYININKSKPSCLIAHTLDPKFLEKSFHLFFLEGFKKKEPGTLPGFFRKTSPNFSHLSHGLARG